MNSRSHVPRREGDSTPLMVRAALIALVIALVTATTSAAAPASAPSTAARFVGRTPSSATSPSPREQPAMAYDPVDEDVVLFGGYAHLGAFNDTWTWDGATWTQRQPVNAPPASGGGAMVSDPSSQTLLLFGGSA